MPSRDFRRAQKKKVETVAETIEKRHTMHPMLYGFSIVVLVVIVVTFVLAGPGGPMGRGGAGGPGNIVFGSYEGHDISYYQGSYFAQERDRLANQMRNQGQQDTRAAAQMVWYQAFISTAEHVAILLQSEKAGVNVSEDAVDKALLNYPGYMDDNGHFSETRYAATSPSDRESTRKLTRESLLTNVFASDIINGVKSGAQETDFVKAMASSERSFTFVSLPFTSFPNEAVRAYADANKARFLHIKLSRILIKSGESQTKEIRKKILDKTSTFEELAKTYSKDEFADKGGDMGWRYAYDVEADFDAKDAAQKVLTLKAGELSDVLKGTFGWLIYRCDSEAVTPDFSNTAVL
jgi:peptidyl-prolyl cis-trans isomerase D